MKGNFIDIETAKKIENFNKLKAENTMLKSNNLAYENIIKCKDKEIAVLKEQIKEQNKLIDKLKDGSKQMDIFGKY